MRRLAAQDIVFLGLVGSLLWYHSANAEMPSIQGRLVDENGIPVIQAPVTVEGTGGQGVAITNQTGDFVFYNLPSGKYVISPMSAPEVQRNVTIEEQGQSIIPWFNSPRESVGVGEIKIPFDEYLSEKQIEKLM